MASATTRSRLTRPTAAHSGIASEPSSRTSKDACLTRKGRSQYVFTAWRRSDRNGGGGEGLAKILLAERGQQSPAIPCCAPRGSCAVAAAALQAQTLPALAAWRRRECRAADSRQQGERAHVWGLDGRSNQINVLRCSCSCQTVWLYSCTRQVLHTVMCGNAMCMCAYWQAEDVYTFFGETADAVHDKNTNSGYRGRSPPDKGDGSQRTRVGLAVDLRRSCGAFDAGTGWRRSTASATSRARFPWASFTASCCPGAAAQKKNPRPKNKVLFAAWSARGPWCGYSAALSFLTGQLVTAPAGRLSGSLNQTSHRQAARNCVLAGESPALAPGARRLAEALGSATDKPPANGRAGEWLAVWRNRSASLSLTLQTR